MNVPVIIAGKVNIDAVKSLIMEDSSQLFSKNHSAYKECELGLHSNGIGRERGGDEREHPQF